MRRRVMAVVALVVGAATVVLAVVVAVSEFPRGLGLLGCVVVAGAAAWYGVLRRGVARVAGFTVAALALAGAVALLVVGGDSLLDELLVVVGLLVTAGGGRRRHHRARGRCRTPSRRADRCCSSTRKSGGGKAERFKLADEARARGIEPIELEAAVGPRGARPRGA